MTLGMVVHAAGDAVTESGAPLLWPLRIRQRSWYPVGSPRPLRFRDHAHDLRENRLTADTLGAHDEPARAIDCGAGDTGSRFL